MTECEYHQQELDRQEIEINTSNQLAEICRAAMLKAPTDAPVGGVTGVDDAQFVVIDLFGTRYTVTIKPE
jgi:hypothetical protein